MIKVLFFIEKLSYKGFIGGAEKVLINLVNNMNPDAFDITVQTIFPDSTANLLAPNIKYKTFFSSNNTITNSIFRIETELGCTYRNHIKGDYDLEIAFLEYCSTKVMAFSTNKKAKKIAWIHCDLVTAVNDIESFKRRFCKIYEKYDKVVCVSEKCKDSYITLFPNGPKAIVLHNVVDSEEIIRKSSVCQPCDAKKRGFTIITVARFSPQKNYMRLLSTVNRLILEGFVFELWIVGDGEQREIICDYVKKKHIEDYVKILGFKENPYPYICEADLLVCSSNYEGFSTFITEGIILGKPILTTDCSGMNELLGDSEFGVIVENSDEAFYNGLKRFLTQNDLITYYAGKASYRADFFSKKHLVNDVERFFYYEAELSHN